MAGRKKPGQGYTPDMAERQFLYSQPVLKALIRYPFTDSTGTIIIKEDTAQMRFLAPKSLEEHEARTIQGDIHSIVRKAYSRPGNFLSFADTFQGSPTHQQ